MFNFSSPEPGIVYVVMLIQLPMELEQSMTTEELDQYMFTQFAKRYAQNSKRSASEVKRVIYINRTEEDFGLVQYTVYGEVDQRPAPPPEPDPEEPTDPPTDPEDPTDPPPGDE
ncbi:hypothetical protein ACQP2H_10490 [Micromonospora sp. CA-248260]|uniref:hypothetical protein n=1 Tax=Micromonospora sp. CA-248260 TaxID=3239962 RepID=UPI003D9350C2